MRFKFWFISLVVFHSSSCITTTTGIIAYAIYQLLFWHSKQFSSSYFICTFISTGCWESPAWSTLTLILNWANSTLSYPVPFWWYFRSHNMFRSWFRPANSFTKNSSILFICPIRKLIQTSPVCLQRIFIVVRNKWVMFCKF